MDNLNDDNYVKKYRDELRDKLIKSESNDKKYEQQLAILVLIIIGVSLLFNTLVPIFAVFLIFYYDANKDKITKIR